MWSHPGLNVETYVETLRSRRSGVMADTPPRSLVHLSQISGPVRSFFSVFACFRRFSVAYRAAVGGSGWAGRLRGAGLGCPGALKPTVRVTVGAAGRLVTLGPGRRGGFFGLGTFDREGLFEVVSDG